MTDRPPGVATLPPGGFISCHHKFEANLLDRTIFGPEIVSGNSVSSIGELRPASALLNAVLLGLRDRAHRVRLGEHCLEPLAV